ncbi:hypothetical protein E2320_005529 [Naja naja]|nr:hypothetical protein E2320_005529 [Naja naja]
MFIQEPDHVIFPMDSEEKKVWLQNGTELDIASDYRYSVIEGSLIINNPSELKDAGQYQCFTTNVYGSILSREATLQFAFKV